MAKSGKKQGGKSKTTKTKSGASKKSDAKKTTAKKPVAKKPVAKKPTTKKSTAKKSTAKKSTKTTKKTKSPASFSKSASTKKSPEFETLKLKAAEKTESKIILRDVEKEKIPEPQKVAKPQEAVEKKVEKVETPQTQQPMAAPKLSAKEIKEQEIEKAVKSATKLPTSDTSRRKRRLFGDFGWTRVILIAACTSTIVFAIAYFINVASSDMSIQVAAMQSGIDATYPSYVPRGFELSDVTSSSGKVIMHFKNSDEEFELSEESSEWDSEALLNNYINPTYGNNYTMVREQGLTLYMGGDWEAWVNGGVLYKLFVNSGTLTKKQMKNIATSL